MKMKKTLMSVVSVVVIAALAIGGTLAFLTVDGQQYSNVFTSGEIAIQLNEEVGVIGTGDGGKTVETANGAIYREVMPGDYLKKEVSVSNTGKNDAYVRVVVILNNVAKINNAIDEVYESAPYNYGEDEMQKLYDSIFDGWGMRYTKYDDEDNALGMRLTITGDDMPEYVMQVDSVKTIDEYTNYYNNNWYENSISIINNGQFPGYYSSYMGTYELLYTYYIKLPAGQKTTLFNGIQIPTDFDAEQMKMFEDLNIEVYADAIQTANIEAEAATFSARDLTAGEIATAKAAFDELEALHHWYSERGLVSSGDALKELVAAGKTKAILTEDVEIDKIDLTSVDGGNFTLIANGHSITSPATASTRAVQIDGAGKEITIVGANINTLQTASNTDSRAIALNPTSSNMKVNLVDCNINMASDNWSFAVNLTGGVTGCEINIVNTTIVGAIPVNIWGDNNVINITDSTLVSNYDHPEWNFSANIIQLNNDGATVAENNTVVIENTRFDFEGENNNGDNGVNAVTDMGNGNTITVKNCTYGDAVTIAPFIASEKDLVAALENAKPGDDLTLYLTNDVAVDEIVEIPEGVAVTIDLGGNTLGNAETMAIRNLGGELTLTNGTVDGGLGNYGVRSDSGKIIIDETVEIKGGFGALSLFNGAEAVINNATLSAEGRTGSSSHLIYVYNSKLTINEGTYTHEGKGADGSVLYLGGTAAVTVNGGTFNVAGSAYAPAVAGKSTLTINGGTFNVGDFLKWGGSVTITGGTFKKNPASNVAEGYEAVSANGSYIVVPETAEVATTTEELKAAVKTANSTVYLASGEYEIGSIAEGVTIIGSGDVTVKSTLQGTLKDTTIKNVTFEAPNAQRWAYSHGTLVFENCEFKATSIYAIHYDGLNGANITYKDCTITGWVAIGGGAEHITFDNCTIYGNGTYGVIRLYSEGTIKNCTFDVSAVNTTDVYQDGIHAVDCTITVENCVNVNGEIEDIFNVSGTGVINKK